MRQMLYKPPRLFGLIPVEPRRVEVLELDQTRGTARVRSPLAPNAFINVIRQERGLEPLTTLEHEVPLSYLCEMD